MSTRIFAGGIGTETNVFSPIPTGYDDYEIADSADDEARNRIIFGRSFQRYREVVSGRGYDYVQGTYAFALPAGLTSNRTWLRLRDTLLDELRAAMPVDGVILTLHGAMAARGVDDCESDLVAAIRDIVGEEATIGALLDNHCDLPPTLIGPADVVITFKEYPHTDTETRASELATIVVDTAEKTVRPVMATFDCRMVGAYPTTSQPMRDFVDQRLTGSEGLPNILSVSLAHGFPFADVPGLGARALVVADGDQQLAADLAETLGREFAAIRKEVTLVPLDLEEGLDHALGLPETGGPVVMADMSDNAGGGAPGDATFVLRALLDRGVTNAGLAPMCDPAAVRLAFAAEEGSELNVRLGGKLGPASGDPLDLTVTVKGLVRGLVQRWPQGEAGFADVPCGDSALLGCEGVDIVVISNRHQAFGTELFTAFGVDPSTYRLICVKSINHFNAAYGPIASEIVYSSPPGALVMDPRKVSYKHADVARRYPWVDDPWADEGD